VADLNPAHRVGDGPGGGIEFRRHCLAGDPAGSFGRALAGEGGGADGGVHPGRAAVPEREQQPPDVGLGQPGVPRDRLVAFRGGRVGEQADGVDQRILVSRIRLPGAHCGRPAGRVADDQVQRVRIRQRRRAALG
jgi:hypothetical protein